MRKKLLSILLVLSLMLALVPAAFAADAVRTELESDGMADAVALGLFGGTQDTGGRVWLRPGESATRAEIAAVLARFGRNVAHLL